MMKAIQITESGTTTWSDYPLPQYGPDQVLIRVAAAGVNRADILQRRGLYAVPPGASPILGLEVSGTIEAVGPEVIGWKVGDHVCSLIEGGGYAEFVAAPASYLLRVPKSHDLISFAAVPEAFITAYLNLYLEGKAQPGELVLIHAAASGVGVAALQLCQKTGNPTIGTSSGVKHELIARYGSKRLIDRKMESFRSVIDRIEPKGVDLILDFVGGPYLDDNLMLLKTKGRLVNVGLLGGPVAQLNMEVLLTKQLRLIGSVLRPRPQHEKTEIIKHFVQDVWHFLEQGEIQPVIHTTFPIEEVEEAHSLLLTNTTTGKILLTL